MAILNNVAVKDQIPVRARCLLGRDSRCDVRVASPKVSADHALLRWAGEFWALQDLGSRNGTFLGDRRLAAGEQVRLEEGATFSLSRSAAAFELSDASPPGAAARHEQTGAWLVASGGVLALPGERHPAATLFSTGDGRWMLESNNDVRPAVHGEQITIQGDVFTLEIPAPAVHTQLSHACGPLLETIRMRLAVTPDEEQVDVTVFFGGHGRPLPSRRYHYLLLTLARIWLAEAEAPPSLRGWVDRDDLCRKLDLDLNKLNVEIHRARKQLASIGVEGAAGLVERRPGTHEIRIGVRDLEVVRL